MRDKGVLMTGASRGLGAALATELVSRGARVALVARNRQGLEALAGALRAQGGTVEVIVGDVGAKDDVYAISGLAAEALGRVDVLVNNASSLGPVPMPLLGDTSCESLEQTLAVNLVGPFRLTKAVVGPMLLRGEGLVVNISSDAAVSGYPRWGAYGASKAALDQLTRVWAVELEETGVRFLAVDPGEMDTQMHADAMPEADRSLLARPADVARRLVAMIESNGVPSGSRVTIDGRRAS